MLSISRYDKSLNLMLQKCGKIRKQDKSKAIEFQGLSLAIIINTDITLKLFLSFMPFYNMLLQNNIFRTGVMYSTKFTSKTPLFLMNHRDMCFQSSLIREVLVTNFTFERLFSFMNRSKMCFQVTFLRKHLKRK